MANPRRARAMAQAAIAVPAGGDVTATVTAHRALGLATRELHDAAGGAVHLRRAVSIADRSGVAPLAAEARMSLALVLDDLGRPRAALRAIDLARQTSTGLAFARATMQRAVILRRMGRCPEALADYRVALNTFRRYGDRLWQARALTNRGVLYAYTGEIALAEADLLTAQRLYTELGLATAVAQVQHNRGFVAAQAGDVAAALAWYDRAERYFRRDGSPAVALIDRAELLLATRLLPEARAAATAAVAACANGRLGSQLAQARLLLARVELVAGQAGDALRAARAARHAFVRQGRQNWAALGRYVEVLALTALGRSDRRTLRAVRQAASALEATGWLVPAWDAWLDAAQLAIRLGDIAGARADLERSARARRRGPARVRSRAWHVRALVLLRMGDRGGATRAASAGLREFEAHLLSLGATELRVRGAAEATELGALRLRLALAQRTPRQALIWAQRCRAGAIRTAPIRSPTDPATMAELVELRRINAELSAAPADPGRALRLLRRQSTLEDSVRRRAWQTPAGVRRPSAVALSEIASALGDRVLVEMLQLDGQLHALVLTGGRARHRVLGDPAVVHAELDALRFAQRRLVGYPTVTPASAAAATAGLAYAARALDELLFAPLADLLGVRPLVLAPTGALHAVPWSMLPTCRGRATSVVPSATVWYSAVRAAAAGPVVLVAAPAPRHAVDEVHALARVLPTATVLAGARARCADVLAALDGAGIGHIACHGTFRTDNPLFSGLHLADGSLSVYDLAGLRRPPALLVLSTCDGGLSTVHPGDGLLGLSASVLGMGTRTVVASVGPVDDAGTTALMVDFHRRVSAGAAPAAALAAAQASATGRFASTHAFVCLGAG